ARGRSTRSRPCRRCFAGPHLLASCRRVVVHRSRANKSDRPTRAVTWGTRTKCGTTVIRPHADPAEPLALPDSSRPNADDRLPRAPLDRVEGGDGIVEGRDGPDVRSQSSVADPLDDFIELDTIGLDNEVDRQPGGGVFLARPDDGHKRSSGPNQARGPLPDVATDEIEHQVD